LVNKNLIEVKELKVRYPDGSAALKGVSFEVGRGERCALVGANGAGKSTLILALAGLIPIEGGAAVLDGMAVLPKNFAGIRKKIGVVFQNPDDQLFMPRLYDDIAFGPRNSGVSEEKTREETLKTAESLNIAHLLNKHPGRLSGGEKRSAALAGVLTLSPDILLLDEPISFLDPAARRRLIGILSALPHTQLIATHDLEMAAELCGRTILLKDGKTLFSGGPDLLKDRAALDEAGLI
jgi:cobalt/nickel transport system ATP-binding protein